MTNNLKKIKISFLEREFFAEDRTGTTVKGYEPAMTNIEGEIKFGRVIDTKRLGEAQFTDTELFQTTIPLVNSNLNLVELLKDNENGKVWLKKLREHSLHYSRKEIPTTLSISCVQIPKKVEYSLFPEDYTEKGRGYTCPMGYLATLPETAVYFVVKPPMIIEDSKRITSLNWHRKIISSNGIFDGYSIKDVKEENPFKTLQGDLFGTLNSRDLIDKIGKWEDCFPLTHYLKISYPVALRDLGQMNPLTIRIQPAETFKN